MNGLAKMYATCQTAKHDGKCENYP